MVTILAKPVDLSFPDYDVEGTVVVYQKTSRPAMIGDYILDIRYPETGLRLSLPETTMAALLDFIAEECFTGPNNSADGLEFEENVT
jgi:hypothetical protein